MSITEITIGLIAMLIAAASLALSYYRLELSDRRKQRNLINAIYCHVELTTNALKVQRKNHPEIEQQINSDESYTPYIPHSSADDLTYDHVIDVMEWLNSEDEKMTVLYYFRSHLALRTLAADFQADCVKNLPWTKRKELWVVYKKQYEFTLEYAEKIKDIPKIKKILKR